MSRFFWQSPNSTSIANIQNSSFATGSSIQTQITPNHLATLQQQQQQILAVHHQQQQQQYQQQQQTPTASVAAVQQAHAAAVAANGSVGQPQSAIHATLMQQMAAVAAAAQQQQHPHSQQSTNTAAGLQAVMQQQLQQTAAAAAAGSATHPMAAALAQASGKNAQYVASIQQQHQQQQQQQAAVAAAAAASAGSNTSMSVSLPPGMAVAVQHPQIVSNVGQNASANNAGQLVPSSATPSLAWPIFQPIVHIPFFDMATYQKVNLDVQPSAMANGMDLPLSDINTLRFFFNFGVQHARAILLRQHINSQQQQQQQQQLALLHNAGTGGQAGQELNNANEQLQMQQKLLMQQNILNNQMTIVDNNSNVEGNRVVCGQTIQYNTNLPINEQIGQNIYKYNQNCQDINMSWQVNASSNGGNTPQGLILMQQNQNGGEGGGEMSQQIVGIGQIIGGNGGIINSNNNNNTGQINYGRTETPGNGGRVNEMGGGNGGVNIIMNENQIGKFNNRGNIPTKFYGNKKSVNVIGQQLLQERAQSDAAAVAAAAASISEKNSNGSNNTNAGGVANNAAAAAAQLLHGGIVGFQNQLQMNQLVIYSFFKFTINALIFQAALMASQQSQQNAKLASLSNNGVDSSADLGSGNVGAAGQQLRSSSQQNTTQQQTQLAAMQQLLLQQQQQHQLTAVLAAQQQQQEQQQADVNSAGHQRQTPLNDLVRSHFLNSTANSNGNNNGNNANNGNSVNRTPNSTPSNHSNNQGNGHGGGSTNGTPRPINGRNSVNGSQQQTTLSGNASVSPKTGSVGVPTDPAPRKQSMILSNPLNAELGELKQRGLNALRSPEAMSDGLQKRLIEMAATLTSTIVAPMSSSGGVGGGSGNGNGGNLISTGGGFCNGSGNVPPAVLLQQQQQIYQHQQQLLQQQSLQQQLIQAQQQQQIGPVSSQNQQTSLANNFSNAVSNQRSQSNNGQQQLQHNTSLLQSMIPSAETEGAPSLLAATEMHYTETFRQEGGNKKIKPATPQSGRQPPELEVGAGLNQRRKSGMNIKEEKPSTPQSTSPPSTQSSALTTTAISTSAMMNYMSNILTNARSHLQGQGLGICYDQNGNQIDYSSRPIDPIFRKAREELSHSPNLSAASVAGAATSLSLSQVTNMNVSNAIPVASVASTASSTGENTLTTSAVGGDLGILSRTCLIGISDTNRRGSIGGAQQLASAQQMTVQQPIPLTTALYPGNLTPQQLQQHYFQLQQQQQLQHFQQLQAQLQQQQQLQQGMDNNNTSLDGSKKRVHGASGIGSEEGPSPSKSARSSFGNSGIELTQERQTCTSSSADLVVDTNNVQCSSGPQQLEREEISNNDNSINIIDGNISDSSKQKLNENVEDDDFNGNDDNNLINVVVQDNEDEGERAATVLEQGNNNNSMVANIRAQNEEIDSPSNGKQLRIVEDEEDDQ
uniref:Uncharacterized protein n=1 Tax=Meloidogyne hapla TaxID=6305 RepID=A0A1I8B833_MELHA